MIEGRLLGFLLGGVASVTGRGFLIGHGWGFGWLPIKLGLGADEYFAPLGLTEIVFLVDRVLKVNE
jgi:hypothetical protein